MDRLSGVLLPVFSLPSDYSIGSFGGEARNFIDFLSDAGQAYWQILPLNPTSYGDSPYQSPCSEAISPYYIDLPTLNKRGLLTDEELISAKDRSATVDYVKLFNERLKLLKRAFDRFDLSLDEYVQFKKQNADWLNAYAAFMHLKQLNGYSVWSEWSKDMADARIAVDKYGAQAEFYRFLQYIALTQWQTIKDYANEKGIKIIGDAPIYASFDSMDVWANPELFKLGNDYVPKAVAGVPPDAFSTKGQLWGNPVYEWSAHKANNYEWWLGRLKTLLGRFDVLRIDHFRGFSSYYEIPYGSKDATCGKWQPCDGKSLFDAVLSKLGNASIIAEDLGILDDDVYRLLDYTGFAGMKVLQFAFDSLDSDYLPENYKSDNCVVYTGTHDNMTTRQWYDALSPASRKFFEHKSEKKPRESASAALIRMAQTSKAATCIIPIQDYMNLGGEARINEPSTDDGNWKWRLSVGYATKRLRDTIASATAKGKRIFCRSFN